MDTLNKTLSVHAVQMLTMCYFPGLIGAYIQLFRGTKYSRFPNWLDRWLKMRKQLGLLMLFSACLHVSVIQGYSSGHGRTFVDIELLVSLFFTKTQHKFSHDLMNMLQLEN